MKENALTADTRRKLNEYKAEAGISFEKLSRVFKINRNSLNEFMRGKRELTFEQMKRVEFRLKQLGK